MFDIIERVSSEPGTGLSYKVSKEICPAFFAA